MNAQTVRRAPVLVVDDEVPMLEVFVETVQRLGLEVVAESDPRKAAERVRGGEVFGLVVLDLRLPFVDGVKLLELIRSKDPDLPVIVVTGYPSAASAKRCRELGVLHYLRKPFDPAELSRHVRTALERS